MFLPVLVILLGTVVSGDDWSDQCVYAHNECRDLHTDTLDLTWSESLAAQAQTYLDSQVSTGSVPHSCPAGQNCGYGENIYTMGAFDGTTRPPCANAVYAWYRESVNYKYDYTLPFYEQAGATGHFTQLVWRGSSEVGCGVALAPGPGWYILCHYKSPGNVNIQGDGMAEAAVSNVGPLEADAQQPDNPGDLMEVCEDMYPDICPYLDSQCDVYWSMDFGPATLCPKTCLKC